MKIINIIKRFFTVRLSAEEVVHITLVQIRAM